MKFRLIITQRVWWHRVGSIVGKEIPYRQWTQVESLYKIVRKWALEITCRRTSNCPFLKASWLSVEIEMNSRTGTMAAFLQSSFRSEPESPSVSSANLSTLKPGSIFVSFRIYEQPVWGSCSLMANLKLHTKVRILVRCSALGSPTAKRLGIRRRMAESISFGRFVAPSTRILSVPDNRPSQRLTKESKKTWQGKGSSITHVMNSALIMPVTSWSPLVLSLRNESISSIKMIDGWAFLARLNNPATNLLDSPYHLFVSTEAAMLIKVAPDSLASAFASIVFPHPGGP